MSSGLLSRTSEKEEGDGGSDSRDSDRREVISYKKLLLVTSGDTTSEPKRTYLDSTAKLRRTSFGLQRPGKKDNTQQ